MVQIETDELTYKFTYDNGSVTLAPLNSVVVVDEEKSTTYRTKSGRKVFAVIPK